MLQIIGLIGKYVTRLYREQHCLVRKKPALGIFLDIVNASDNVTFNDFEAALRGLGMSKILTS